MYENLNESTEIQEEKLVDTLGGYLLPTGIYPVTIDMAYMSKSKKGADAVNFVFKTAEGKEMKETIYVTNRKGETFYIDKKDQSKKYLPGYNQVNAVCALAADSTLGAVAGNAEELVIKIWDFDARADINTSVPVLTDLIGKRVVIGIHNIKENKNVEKSPGEWVPGPELRNINTLDKTFNEEGFTQAELKTGAKNPEFLPKWKKKYGDKEIDKSIVIAGSSTAGMPTVGASTPDTLFPQ